MSDHTRPDYSSMKGKAVTVTLHPWAFPGPSEGVFLGSGDHGISLGIEGGGRWRYRYADVAKVEAAVTAPAGPRPGVTHEEVIPTVGETRQEWCPRCLKHSVAAATITAVTSQGVHTIGGCAICEECAWSPYA
ncbi:hypothetical protein [Microtetraspora malaysiensis]|uniref:Uncharacterized protein n=1 Tax=Microtetraspora malaysiensis TaxID=161358 RepID=A0ABW6SKG6_9ACTN